VHLHHFPALLCCISLMLALCYCGYPQHSLDKQERPPGCAVSKFTGLICIAHAGAWCQCAEVS
jgi:hypothetical protein